MTETQIQLERLRTLQESYHDLADTLPTLGDKIDNIEFPETDISTLAKETTLQEESAEIKNKIENIDLSSVAKLGEDPEATNTAIMLSLDAIKELIGEVVLIPNNDNVGEGNQAWTLVLNKTLSVNNGAIE